MSQWLSPRRHPDPIEAAAGLVALVVVVLLALGAAAAIVDALT